MKGKRIILLFLSCLFIVCSSYAQNSADDFFHKAANFYINTQKKDALRTIQEGIRRFPNDEKLKNIAKAIDELPDPNDEQQQQQQQQQEQQDKKDEQDAKNQENNDQQQAQEQQPQEQQMSKEQAQQMLDALMQDEKETMENAKKMQTKTRKSADKDW